MEATPSGYIYRFTLRLKEGHGERIEGTITPSGTINISKREPSFNTCPICLAEGTLIDTPDGPLPVERLQAGMTVWTADGMGNRTRGIILKKATTPAPPSFQVVIITLDDGRTVTASPGHPTAEGRPLGDYRVDDLLDGAVVTTVEYLPYDGHTWDILPSGDTGLYWANGVRLKSTLAAK